jgi:DNA-binding LacI/PurR family transcriptional regulator
MALMTLPLLGPSTPLDIIALFQRMLVRGMDCTEEAGMPQPRNSFSLSRRPRPIDNIPKVRLVEPPLITIAQYPAQLGERAAELLLERLAGHGPHHGRCETLPFDLVVRQSA